MKIHILTDNRAKKRGILAEHGLSLLVEHEGTSILFDTGQTDVFLKNASAMGADPGKADCVVLSHGHYDHCGGAPFLAGLGRLPKIYVHRAAFEKKFAAGPGGEGLREVGIPWTEGEREALAGRLVLTGKRERLAPGAHLFGEIPGLLPFEGVPTGFFRGEGAEKAADMQGDEQMLVLEGERGLSVFLGCGHPGVINCLHYAQKQFPGERIYSLAAGMHLDSASPLRVQMTISHLQEMGVEKIIPLHCTGIFAICEMRRFLGSRCLPFCAGDTAEL